MRPMDPSGMGVPMFHRRGIADGSLRISASFGVASQQGSASTATSQGLIHDADEALYQAKQHGRNLVIAN